LVLVRGLHEDQTGNTSLSLGSEDAHIVSSERRANQNHRPVDANPGQKFREFIRNSAARAGAWARVAVAHACSIVSTYLRESGHFRHHVVRAERRTAQTALEDYYRIP
jgi:transposase